MSRQFLPLGMSLVVMSTPLPAETVTYSYDARGRLVAASHSGSVNNGLVTSYVYDDADNRVLATTSGSANPAAGTPTEAADILYGSYGPDAISGLGGADIFYLQQGGDETISGGSGNDAFLFGAGLNAADIVNGGPDQDQLVLTGNYQALQLGGNITNIESFSMLSSEDNRFGDASGSLDIRYNYTLVLADQLIPPGQSITFDAAQLRAGERLAFDGSAETDGSVRVYGGRAEDLLTGGAGADLLVGRHAADRINGLGGADTLQYRAGEWTGDTFDTIVGFDEREDRIDLPVAVGGFAAPVGQASVSTASFRNDIAAAVPSLGAGQAVLVTATAGSLSGRTFLVVNTDGIAGYGADDLAIDIEAPPVPVPASTHIFI